MVTLQEHRAAETFSDRRRQDDGRVLGRALFGVEHLAARQLEHERANLVPHGRAEGGARQVVTHGAKIHGRRGKGVWQPVVPTPKVEGINGGRADVQGLRRLPDQPPRHGLARCLGKDGQVNQGVNTMRTQHRLVAHSHATGVGVNLN
jgi:hypothetical protein